LKCCDLSIIDYREGQEFIEAGQGAMEDFRKAAVGQVVVNGTAGNMEDIDNMKESSEISIEQATLS